MPHAEKYDDLIHVTTVWTESEVIKAIPGSRWRPNEKVWTVPLTFPACLQLRGSFGDSLTVGPELATWSRDEYIRRVAPAHQLRSEIKRVDAGDVHSGLYDFQTAGVAFLDIAENALLGDDLGMGKTAQILGVVRKLLTRKPAAEVLPALVICPNSVKTGWDKQIKIWSMPVKPYVLTGSTVQRRKILEAAADDPHAFVITNIESVRLLSRQAPFGSHRLSRCRTCDPTYGEEKITPARCAVHPKPLNDFGFKTVIIDEAHRIKDPASQQTRACWAVGHDSSVEHRFALTGTPVANHVGDLWSIMHFLAPHEYPTKGKFVDRYGLQAWNAFGGLDIVGINPLYKDEFYKILDARFRRTPKALVLTQLPKVVRVTRWVDMDKKQVDAYNNLEANLVTRLDNGQVLIAKNNLVNATRLLQLSSSYCNVEYIEQTIHSSQFCNCADVDGATRHQDDCLGRDKRWCVCHTLKTGKHREDCADRLHVVVTLAEPSPKLDAMEEDIDALGNKPVVVAAMSRQLIELAAKRLKKRKIPYGLITGAVTEWERQQTIQRFINGQIRVVLMTIGAGGTGVDGLQHADTMLVLQRSWSMIENVQVDGRVDRIGSEKHDSVTIVDYVARGTIEETTQHPRLAEKYLRLEEINRDRVRLADMDTTAVAALVEEESRILASHLGAPM